LAEDAPPAGRRLALLIGNQNYAAGSGFENLRGPHNDVDRLAEVLTDPARGGFELWRPALKDAANTDILGAIERLLKQGTAQDTVLIHYSGHGKLDDHGDLHFAAANTNDAELFGTGFSAHALHRLALASRCREIVLLLDCCFAGAIGQEFGAGKKGGDETAKVVEKQLERAVDGAKGVFVLASSTGWQTSQEVEAEADGVVMGRFTRAVVERLTSAEALHQGDVRFHDLARHLQGAFPKQEPRVFTADADGGDPLIARALRVLSPVETAEGVLADWYDAGTIQPGVFNRAVDLIHGTETPRRQRVLDLLAGPAPGHRAFLALWNRGEPARPAAPGFSEAAATAPPPPRAAPPPPPPVRWTPPRKPLAVWREPIPDLPEAACPEMVTIPFGRFRMGAPADEEGSGDDERPQREVIVEAFALGRCAVTFAQWDAAIEAGAILPFPGDAGRGRGDRPVVNVGWEDARAYCAWLNDRLGIAGVYRLPSEAEWEYACRAGTTTPFSFGATLRPEQANYDGNYTYGAGVTGEDRERTVPAGSLPANPWKLHEIHGNVWEWVEDAYGSYPDHPTDGRPLEYSDIRDRILRGGSWVDDPRRLRSAIRGRSTPDTRNIIIGFRLARTLL